MQPTFGRRNAAPVSAASAAAATPAAPRYTPANPAPSNPAQPSDVPLSRRHWVDRVLHVLFSPSGRIPRGYYRVVTAFSILLYYIAIQLCRQVLIDAHAGTAGAFIPSDLWLASLELFTALFLFGLALWSGIAGTIKRWHDMDRTGWWTLLFLVPLIGWLGQLAIGSWVIGTRGPNRFGPPAY